MATNFEKFAALYAVNLRACVESNAKDYAFPLQRVPQIAARMVEAFRKGSYNKNGKAIEMTCKELGIKHTYKAINAYLADKPSAPAPADFVVRNEGTIFLFNPRTARAQAWLDEHCTPDGEHQYFGSSLVVEHRYARDIAALAQRDGLKVE